MQNFQFDILKKGAPILVAKLPKPIVKEMDVWASECKKTKDHPLSYLKAHENVGYDPDRNEKYNEYQCPVPVNLIEDSYWLAYTVRLCAHVFGGNHRNYFLSRRLGHFDGYDIWANFAYKGNENPPHIHAGDLSGVIYHKNHKHPTHFPDYDTKYKGNNGTMILFPSNVKHYVKLQNSEEERITFAFNIGRLQ